MNEMRSGNLLDVDWGSICDDDLAKRLTILSFNMVQHELLVSEHEGFGRMCSICFLGYLCKSIISIMASQIPGGYLVYNGEVSSAIN